MYGVHTISHTHTYCVYIDDATYCKCSLWREALDKALQFGEGTIIYKSIYKQWHSIAGVDALDRIFKY